MIYCLDCTNRFYPKYPRTMYCDKCRDNEAKFLYKKTFEYIPKPLDINKFKRPVNRKFFNLINQKISQGFSLLRIASESKVSYSTIRRMLESNHKPKCLCRLKNVFTFLESDYHDYFQNIPTECNKRVCLKRFGLIYEMD